LSRPEFRGPEWRRSAFRAGHAELEMLLISCTTRPDSAPDVSDFALRT